MIFNQNQIEELKQVSPGLSQAEEGGRTYFLLKNYPLPHGCIPASMDLLLCPNPGNGYTSTLYFASKPSGCPQRNWLSLVHILSQNWISFSWQSSPGHTLLQMLHLHLDALNL